MRATLGTSFVRLPRLYQYRYGLFLISLHLVVFALMMQTGSVLQDYLTFILLATNIYLGLITFKGNKYLYRTAVVAFITTIVLEISVKVFGDAFQVAEQAAYMFTFAILVVNIFSQILNFPVKDSAIFFLIYSSFICIGLVMTYSFYMLEMVRPGAILPDHTGFPDLQEIMYFSFSTELTLGYGDLTPRIPLARMLVIFFNIFNQFYNLVVVSIIITKYMNIRRM